MDKNQIRIENLEKSKSDKREYLYKQLQNGMKVILVSDPEADKSSGALNVNIGSLSDPADFPGLAHFCEHMLFMGTEKYPKEDEYSEFLNANSGTYNAWTDLDATNYFFEISNEAFEEAVDRFAQFFLKPLFVQDPVEREMKAVDSENKKNLQNDVWRFLQLQRSESTKESVFSRFSTGNLETLNKPHIRDALLEMHSKYYCSSLMALALLSPKPLSELEKMVDNLFTDVKRVQELSLPKYDSHPAYDKSNSGYFYYVEPVRDQDSLTFYWFLPDNSKYYKQKPLNYLSSLIGHEGPNSLCSSLMQDDYITNLVSGFDSVAQTYATFYLTITLTKKGLEKYEDVIKRVLYFIQIIQSQPINKRFFEENQIINKLKFDFKSKEQPMNYVSDLAYNFRSYAPSDILKGGYIIEEYDENLIRSYLDAIQLSNLNIYLISRSVSEKCTESERWYGTKYSKHTFTEDFIKNHSKITLQTCTHNLAYPPENVFIPKSLELRPEPKPEEIKKHPEKILDEEGIVVWYKRDTTFKLPKAVVICQIYLNKSSRSFYEYEAIAYVWNSIIENELREISYMAREANVSFKFHTNNEGLYLSVTGFDYSMKNALIEIMKIFKNIQANDKEEKLKTQIIRHIQDYTNFFLRQPYSQAIAYIENLITDPSAPAEEKLKILQRGVEISTLVDFVSKFLKESRFEWLIQGNVLPDEAVEMGKVCVEIIQEDKLPIDKTIIYRTVNISPKWNAVYQTNNVNPKEENSVICTFLQCGKLDDKGSCILLVIESLFKDKFFNELRTKQALGYIAMLFHREYRCNEGLMCLVQSAVKSAEYIWQKIKEFFEDAEKSMSELTDELFNTHVNSVIVEKKQKDITLADEVYRNAHEIKKKQFVFDRREQHVKVLEQLKKQEVIEFYDNHFVKNLRRLDVEIIAANHIEENAKFQEENAQICQQNELKRLVVKSIADFKRRNSLYPDFFSG
jgi:insulysin